MAIDISALYVYRIVSIHNLEADLLNGLICKSVLQYLHLVVVVVV